MIDGAKIRQLRMKAGMTMAELGYKIGVTEAMVSQLERNLRDTNTEKAQRIADALNVTVNDLLLARR